MNQQYECMTCDYVLERWSPRCPSCQSWITSKFTSKIVGVHHTDAHAYDPSSAERQASQTPVAATMGSIAPPMSGSETAPAPRTGPIPITDVTEQDCARILTGIEPLDRVLGGGFAQASIVLLGGDPGIGKSTLLAQMMASVPCERLLYATGEETLVQAAIRARRIGATRPHISIVAEADVDQIIEDARTIRAEILVVDSIQTMRSASLPSAPGSVGQVRECTGRLMRFAKGTKTTTILVGHITKDGALAGPETMKHLVDVILQFELDPEFKAIRILRCDVKNRFGDTTETGAFEMTATGLRAISPDDAPPRRGERDEADAMTPIAQELVYRLLELGGTLDDGLLDRIGTRLDLVPRSAP